ncbi:MAG: hypothetical protein ACJ77K_17715 [Bacteroidia bacterium]
MKVAINIKLRNPDWFWEPERMKDKKGEMTRKEWEMINEDKVSKYRDAVDFEYNFDVINHTVLKETDFPVTLYSENDENRELVPQDVVLKNMRVVEFTGANTKSVVAVSNDIIHEFFEARKKKGRDYWYFYIKEDVACVAFTKNLWISKKQFSELGFVPVAKNGDPNLVERGTLMHIPAKGGFWEGL